MDAPILHLENVRKSFGDFVAVSDVSFRIGRGRITALLGASGSGKTTTLRMIAGFIEPEGGEIRIGGKGMRHIPPYERNIGLVFQDYALFPHMTVSENIAYGLRRRHLPDDMIRERVVEMCRLVRLQGFEERKPASLSGGQQQRVALGRALAIRPSLLLLDEPLSALDAKLRHDLRFELKNILSESGCTTLIVTHDQEEAMSLADSVLVMHQGKLMQEGTPMELYSAPNSRLVAEFVGRANWFEGGLALGRDGDTRSFVSSDGPIAVHAPGATKAGVYDLCLRPERLGVHLSPPAGGTDNCLKADLLNVAYLGREIHYALRLASGREILAIETARGQAIPAAGTALFACFRPSDCILVPR